MSREQPSDDAVARYTSDNVSLPERASPYPVSRLAPPIDIVDVARQIRDADRTLSMVTEQKLTLIADQIKELQARAHAILEAAELALDLHRVPCNFVKRVGATVHLYARKDGTRLFSIVGPEEWGGSPPFAFVASYRLGADMSFEPTSSGPSSP